MHDTRKLAVHLFLTMPFMVATAPLVAEVAQGIERSDLSGGQHSQGLRRVGLPENAKRGADRNDDQPDEA